MISSWWVITAAIMATVMWWHISASHCYSCSISPASQHSTSHHVIDATDDCVFKSNIGKPIGENCLTKSAKTSLSPFYALLGGLHSVGVNKNWTLVIVNFSAQDASILKISVTIFKRRSWGFQNTPSLQSLDDFEPSYGTLKKNKSFSKSWSYSINFKIQVNL